MNIKELKSILDSYPETMRVVVSGYESGYADIDKPISKRIALNVYKSGEMWYEGTHQDTDDLYVSPKHKKANVLILRRKSRQ